MAARKSILIELDEPVAESVSKIALKNKRSTRKEIEVAVEMHVAASVRDTRPPAAILSGKS
jgi:hypothetical protein